MSSKPDEAKAGLIEKTVEHAHAKLPAEQAARLEAFIRIYYGAVAADDLLERSVNDLYGAALAHLNFASRRTPGEPRVHVYTPQLEEHGWSSTHTVVEIVNDDMPFLVDSVSMELNRQGSGVHLIIHPVVQVRRDEEGRLLEVLPHDASASDCVFESFIHAEIVRETEPEHLEQVREGLGRVLADVRAAVEDWPAMVERGRAVVADLDASPPPVDPEGLAETKALLEWILDNHFTFLGYHEYDLVTEDGEEALRRVPDTGLGILRDRDTDPGVVKLPREAQGLAREKDPLVLTKANSRATVHRPSYLDYVGVKRFDESGEVVGERRFLGLYTSSAYSARPDEIPLLRRKARTVRERSGFPPGSHADKALVEILETYPRDELFQISDDDLFEITLGILHLGERQRVRLFVRRDRFGRFLSCLVFVPAGPLQHAGPGGHPGDPPRGLQRGQRRLQRSPLGVRARQAPLRHLHAVGPLAGLRRPRDRGPPRGGDPLVGGRPARRARRAARGGARHRALRAVPRCVPCRLSRRLHSSGGRPRHPANGAARPAGRSRHDALPAARGRRRLLRPEAAALGAADPSLRRAPPARGPRCEGLRRTAVRDRPARPDRCLDLRLRPHERGGSDRPGRHRGRVQGRVRPGLAWRDRGRRLQPPGAPRRPLLAAGRHAPRAGQVPPPGREHLQPGLHGGGARRPRTDRGEDRRPLPRALRPGPRGRPGRRG